MKRTLALAAALLSSAVTAAEPSVEPIYELRIYTCNEGKLPDLLQRFENHTVGLFEKHGMENIGYWVPVHEEDGAADTLIYVLRHASREAAAASFKAFGQDPDWQAARKASEVNGKILAERPQSIFMAMSDFSPALNTENAAAERVFELRTYTVEEGRLDALHERFRSATVDLFSKHGMTHIAYWNPVEGEEGAGVTLTYILAHDSEEAAKASFDAFREDPDWHAARDASVKDGPIVVKRGVTSVMMTPTSFSALR